MIIIRLETFFPTAFIFMAQDIVRSALFQLSMITAIELRHTYHSSFAIIAKESQKHTYRFIYVQGFVASAKNFSEASYFI